MRVPKPPKSTFRKMMEEEELKAKAAGCPPGHTYNENVKKCLPGSPLSGIPVQQIYDDVFKKISNQKSGERKQEFAQKPANPPQTSGNSGKSKPSANAMIAAEAYQRTTSGKSK